MNKKEIKEIVRKEIRNKRENLSFDEKEKLSCEIIKRLFENFSEQFEKAEVIMSYMDFKNEVSTKELNKRFEKEGKKLLIPRVSEDKSKIIPVVINGEYKKGNFGILESKGADYTHGNIDIVIVPGVVFNSRGERIGFGKGYYDKFLTSFNNPEKKPLKISLAYDLQINDRFFGEEHDEKIDIIITEKRVIDVRKNR